MKDDQLDPVFILCYPEDFESHLVEWAKNEIENHPEQQLELLSFQKTLGIMRQELSISPSPVDIGLTNEQRTLILKEAQAKALILKAQHQGLFTKWWLNGPLLTAVTALAVGILFVSRLDLLEDQPKSMEAMSSPTVIPDLNSTSTSASASAQSEASAQSKAAASETTEAKPSEAEPMAEKKLEDQILLAKLEKAKALKDGDKYKMKPNKKRTAASNQNQSKSISLDDDLQASNAFPHSQIEIAQAERNDKSLGNDQVPGRIPSDAPSPMQPEASTTTKQAYGPKPTQPVATASSSMGATRSGGGGGVEVAQAPAMNPPQAMPMADQGDSSKPSEEAQSEREAEGMGGRGEDLLLMARMESKQRKFELALEKYMRWIDSHLDHIQLSVVLKEAKLIARQLRDTKAIQHIEAIEGDLMKPEERQEAPKAKKAVDIQLDGF